MLVRLGPVRPVIWILGDICKRCPFPPPKRPNWETEWDRATPPAEPDHSQGHPRGRRNLPWPISDSQRHTRASAAQLTCPVGLPGRLFLLSPLQRAVERGPLACARGTPPASASFGAGARASAAGPRGQAPQTTRADVPHAPAAPRAARLPPPPFPQPPEHRARGGWPTAAARPRRVLALCSFGGDTAGLLYTGRTVRFVR